jgi:hypothetical protein
MIGWISDYQMTTEPFKMINSRVGIQQFILTLEQQFPVNQWKVDSIHLWPHLRIKLFFYLIHSLELSKNSAKSGANKSDWEKLKSNLRTKKAIFAYFKLLKSLPTKENMFVGADAHRVDYKQTRFNRYFDCLIEKNNLNQNSMYFEYGHDSQKQYNKELLYTFANALSGFLYLHKFFPVKSKVDLVGYSDFLNHLSQNQLFSAYCKKYSLQNITNWATNHFYPKVRFFEKVFTKVKPKRVLILCYYIDDVFALTSAANRLNIKTIEMQHGPQTEIHLSYANWSVLPKEGYHMIPRAFWCWDESSHNVIKDWSKNNPAYSVKVIGNPWIDYWKTKKNNFPEKDFILYSLQPSPLTLEQLFPESIINFIKTNSQKWFIRLHPRQLNEKEKIKSYLENSGVLALVNLEEATQEPLPLLLSNALIHLTHFSGTAIEASLFNLKTVLLNEIGLFSFPDLISAQKAVYLNVNDAEFDKKLTEILEIEKNNKNKSFEIQPITENLFN